MDYKKEKYPTLLELVTDSKKKDAFLDEMRQKAKIYVYTQKNIPHSDIYIDAFRHTFSSAVTCFRNSSKTSKAAGNYHEYENMKDATNKSKTLQATIMDLHNNAKGIKYAEEIKAELDETKQPFTAKYLEDKIVEKVFQGINQHELITSEQDKRISEYKKNPEPILNNEWFSKELREYIKNVDLPTDNKIDIPNKKEEKSESKVMFEDALANMWKRNTENIADIGDADYENLSLKDKVFYSGDLEDALAIAKKPSKEVTQYDKDVYNAFYKQYWKNNYKLPRKEELDARVNVGELIYVHEYIKRDGTKVHGYYRHRPQHTKNNRNLVLQGNVAKNVVLPKK